MLEIGLEDVGFLWFTGKAESEDGKLSKRKFFFQLVDA